MTRPPTIVGLRDSGSPRRTHLPELWRTRAWWRETVAPPWSGPTSIFGGSLYSRPPRPMRFSPSTSSNGVPSVLINLATAISFAGAGGPDDSQDMADVGGLEVPHQLLGPEVVDGR